MSSFAHPIKSSFKIEILPIIICRDWFFDAAEQQTNQTRQATSPPSQQNGGRGEYSSLNVPLDDDFGSIQTSQQIMPGTSTQQVVYHQQVNVQQQQVYQPVDNVSL